jgi:copper chaperone CopZ
VEIWEEIESRKYFDKKTERIRWTEGVATPEENLNEPNSFHAFSYRYTYRESLTCGHTFSEIHGAINEVSGGANVPLVQFNYRQGALESNCPARIIAQLTRQMTPAQAAPQADAEITTKLTANAERVAALSTIVVVPKPGSDCTGLDATQMTDLMALGLLETFDIVDRSVMELALAEQKLSMSGLIRDEDWLEAGAMAGAGGILTLQAMCLSNQSILKAKLISAESNLLLLSAIGKEATPEEVAGHIGDAVQDARQAP